MLHANNSTNLLKLVNQLKQILPGFIIIDIKFGQDLLVDLTQCVLPIDQ